MITPDTLAIVKAINGMTKEIHDIYWLMFWLAVLGFFNTTINK